MAASCSVSRDKEAAQVIRQLAPDEVQTTEDKGMGLRKLTNEQYDWFLADYEAGEYGEAELEENEERLTLRNRFNAVAERRGLPLNFIRTIGNTLQGGLGCWQGRPAVGNGGT
jgi:hypothetical protein